MKLKAVNIFGFKTFAKRSEIALDQGLTAVVGPNGSGKSNLVDAIRWVLGETNARELRGARMDEVIYSGGESKAPMGMAEVEIVLDNEDGRINVEDTEISISRKVVRNGDSEYRLNGARVRLKDIERLLSATGLTQTGYSVVAQNDIDAIVQATPSQRRVLIEQAAGVRTVKAACEEAESKVKGVENRLLRLQDVLSEAEPRLQELAQQAEIANQQREFTEKLMQLRGNLAREAWRAARAQAKQARQRLNSAGKRLEIVAVEQADFTQRFEAEQIILVQARQAQQAAGSNLEQARLAVERAVGDMRRWSDRQTASVLLRSVVEQERSMVKLESEAARREQQEVDQQVNELQMQWDSLSESEQEVSAEYSKMLERQRQSEEELGTASRELNLAEQGLNTIESLVREHKARQQFLSETLATLEIELRTFRERYAEEQQQLAEAITEEQVASQQLKEAEVQAQEMKSELAVVHEQLQVAQAKHEHAYREATTAEARVAGLNAQVESTLATGQFSDQTPMQLNNARRLLDCFQVIDPADSAAIEAALESLLGALVVEDLETVFKELSKQAIRSGFLQRDVAVTTLAEVPSGIRNAYSAIKADPAVRGILAHYLQQVWLVDDLSTAKRSVKEHGGKAVLPDGTVIGEFEVRGGGTPGETIELAATQREAQEVASQAVKTSASVRDELEQATQRASVMAVEYEQLTKQLHHLRAVAVEKLAITSGIQKAMAATKQQLERLQTTLVERSDEFEHARSAQTGEVGRQTQLNKEIAALRQRIEQGSAALATVQMRAEQKQEIFAKFRAELDDLALLRSTLQRRQALLQQIVKEAEGRIGKVELRLLSAEMGIVMALARGLDAYQRELTANGDVEASLAEVAQTAEPTAEAEAVMVNLETERSNLAVSLARAQDEETMAAAELAACEAKVAELAEGALMDDDEEGSELDPAAADKAEREIIRLERRISGLGPVNALAPEQYASLNQRVSQVRSDRDDLAKACADIRFLVSELEVEVGRRFDEVFIACSDNFKTLFEELFPGGKAALRLQEPPIKIVTQELASTDDMEKEEKAKLLPGVEIMAQPAGKRLQPLTLLSGGERALTAMALILALQQVNPSPFYLFDEVDAPLDDSNVARFIRVLKRLALEQQFLLVTHNHATMAAADVLYGVTMGRDGTSTILSVRFEPDEGKISQVQPVAAVV